MSQKTSDCHTCTFLLSNDDNEGEKDMQCRFYRRGCCIWCLVIAYKVMEKGHCVVGDNSCLSLRHVGKLIIALKH